MMKTTFVNKGVPVIIGEYSACGNKTQEMKRLYVTSVCEAAYTRGMCPVLWDVTDDYYIRSTATFKDKELLKEFDKIKKLERES